MTEHEPRIAEDWEVGENRKWVNGLPLLTLKELVDLGFDPETLTIKNPFWEGINAR